MTTLRRALLAIATIALPSAALAATITISPGANLTSAIECASDGDTIQLNPGVYTTGTTAGYVDANSFGFGRRVTVVGLGSTPNDVILRGNASTGYTVNFTPYTMQCPGGSVQTGNNPTGATLQNLTIDSGNGGAAITNSSITGITFKDLVVKTKTDGTAFGILAQNTQQIVIDNVTVTSNQSGFYIANTTDSLVMNSTVTGTGTSTGAATLAVIGGSRNRFVGNTFGSPKSSPTVDSGYPVNGGNVVFYNTTNNRFENNLVQGHRDDGLDFSAIQSGLPAGVSVAKSTDNYAGKNTVISTGFAAGRTEGSGIWSNCGSDNTWLYANDSRGSSECGTCVWLSSSNMVLGNVLHDNRLTGAFISGGTEAPPLCPVASFQVKPASNFLRSNSVTYNRNDQIVVRNADSTDISLNFVSPREAFGGPLQSCNPANSFCQAAFSLETDSSATASTGFRVAGNISHENNRGLWSDDGKAASVQFFGNRIISSTLNRFVQSGTLNLDAGATLGGNHWSQHTAFGNPSSTNPYNGIFHDTSNNFGRVVDRYPYQSEDLGRGYGVTVFEPRAGLTAARGTKRTVRWHAPGCVYADITLDGTTTLASNAPNTGYAVVTIPESASIGSHFVRVGCKSAAGTARGQGDSGAFNVASSDLKLLAPGRDDVFNSGETIYVAWKKATTLSNSVTIEYCSNGTSNCSTLASNQTGTFARLMLPDGAASTAYGVVRITAGSATDTTDGVFAVRGASGAGFTNVTAGRKFLMGQMERLEWASPQNSRLVTITATVGGTTRTVASNLPDRGNFDWIVDDLGVGGMTLAITFKTTTGTQIGSTVQNTSGSTLYPTTITFGTTPSIAPGATGSISATTNSGAAVTFSNSTTTSVCTVSGTTVTGLTAGSCTINASAAATGNFAAGQSSLTFNVGTSQTITFGAAPTVTVNGTGTVSATASSGLTVTFSSLTPSICSVSGTTVTGLVAGTCTIAANQAGNGTFSAAPQVTQTFSVVVNTSIPRLVNIATRGRVQTGDNVMIAGFIIGGSKAKKVLITARGPSLAAQGVPGTLADPSVVLYSGATPIDSNDDWQSHANAGQVPSSLAPTNPKESAILTTLNPGAYTAIVFGVGNTSGVAIVEVFEIDLPEVPLINIATRARVETGDNVMIAGLIIQGDAPKTVLLTARGPSLAAAGVPDTLADPKIQLYSGATEIDNNDDWQTRANSGSIPESQKPPNPKEAAILTTLAPGAYTVIVSGVGGQTGIAIVEVFAQ